MTAWQPVCRLADIVPNTGVAALVQQRQLAVIRVGDAVYAVDNRDPFSGANVLARGIVGDTDGELFIASPVYKQRFSLSTGRCLDGDAAIATYACRLRSDGSVEVAVAAP